ncbi:MAG: FtsX-like permease family protein [Gemmatimonadaceae bacterium]|nr:FtsX-like permease family protein [Gemmatimonadaceae bacterium]NUQ94081.1 FtsX-like permease family protein [Gemmatimonadaceae bacterium]NUS96396.1 FtsX-like permease family protein [Gemmatimonadaceae bacterium]
MDTTTLLREALQSIRGNRMRTLLTMLGIVIGVGAVIVLVALGNGARRQIEASINSLGTNVIMIMPGSTTRGGANQGLGSLNSLTVHDAEQIEREATLLSALSPVVVTHSQVIGGESNWSTRVYGVSTDYFTIRDWDASSGEPFDDADVRASRKVALLGAIVAKSLFADADPVGAQIRIGHVPFTVVGVLRPKGQNAGGADEDDIVLIPYTTAQSRLSGDVSIGHILASTRSPSQFPAAQEEIAGILREAHRLNVAGTEDDFLMRDQTQIVRAVTSTTRTMSALLAAIASISLLVGGIGIMNIMLVSVTERTREIGIRRATGARARDVLAQFLVESVALSVVGGLVGLVCGCVGAALLGRVTGWRVATPLSAVLIAVGFSAAVGVFFGLYPARKAAALDPIEALRYE